MDEEQKKKKNEYNKKYRDNNKEKGKEYNKEYYQTPNGKKSNTISNWKRRGLISDDYDKIYERYLNSTKCELCECLYSPTNWKCMDHNRNTGLFRNIVCNSCNTSSKLREMYKNNTSGYSNIRIIVSGSYRVSVTIKKKCHTKTFIKLDDAIIYRDKLKQIN